MKLKVLPASRRDLVGNFHLCSFHGAKLLIISASARPGAHLDNFAPQTQRANSLRAHSGRNSRDFC